MAARATDRLRHHGFLLPEPGHVRSTGAATDALLQTSLPISRAIARRQLPRHGISSWSLSSPHIFLQNLAGFFVNDIERLFRCARFVAIVHSPDERQVFVHGRVSDAVRSP